MFLVVDRFEKDFAVVELEDKTMVDIPRKALPKEAKEGSVLKLVIDDDATKTRASAIDKKMNDLFK